MTTSLDPTARGLDLARVPWLGVAVYVVLACGLAWLVMLPVWLGGQGLADPLALPLIAAMMFTPTIAALVVTLLIVRPERKARFLGLVPLRPIGRKLLLILVWPVLFTLLGFAAFFVAALLGWVQPDFSMAGFRTMLPEGADATTVLIVTYATMHVSMVMGSLTAVGEEIGWRGFLVPATAPLGFWPGALLRGVIWGVWHAPVLLLGFNFMRTDAWGIALMCGFTVTLGVILDWSRYWTRSVWPAVFGHGAINAVAPSTFLFMPDDADPTLSTIVGVPGWIVLALLIGVMATFGAFRRRALEPLIPAPTK